MRKIFGKKRFQVLISISVLLFTLSGTLTFTLIAEGYFYNALVKQTHNDNTTIGKSILGIINQNPDWINENYNRVLQETCDMIKLPNNGYICVVDSTGKLIAAPGLKPENDYNISGATYFHTDRASEIQFKQFFEADNFQGFYEYPHKEYSDIISSIKLNQLNLKMLIHQDNNQIKKIARERVWKVFYYGIIISVIFSLIAFYLINKQISSYQFKIQHQNTKLIRSNKNLKALNREKEGLTSIMAHDLKSPLNNIKSIIDILTTSNDIAPENEEMVSYLELEVDRGIDLINDILTISKLESPGQKAELETVDLSHFWDTFILGHKESSTKKDITFNTSLPEKPVILLSEKNSLLRILDNMISNAVKYTPHGKNVYISIKDLDESFNFEIKDEGLGISDEELPKLFEKFAIISTNPTGEEISTGLGLYISSLLSRQIGAKINVTSQQGIGSTFTLIVPKGI